MYNSCGYNEDSIGSYLLLRDWGSIARKQMTASSRIMFEEMLLPTEFILSKQDVL